MGEIIRTIKKYEGFDVELNKSTTLGGPRYIHLQNPKGRVCITETEFVQILSSIYAADKQLRINKLLGEENYE